MEVIEMPLYNGYDHISIVVNHLSKFRYLYPVKTKTSEEIGKSLYLLVDLKLIESHCSVNRQSALVHCALG
jgi:hypothetical protein